VACPVDAIAIVQSYYAEEPGFWATKPHRPPAVPPLKPKDKDGNPDQWNVIEQAIFDNPAVLRMGWALLHFLWQGTGIAPALKGALRSVSRSDPLCT
jgi:hypothetical protein